MKPIGRTALTRRAIKVTQAEVTRVMRAAKAAGGGTVDVLTDGTIRVNLARSPLDNEAADLAGKREVVL